MGEGGNVCVHMTNLDSVLKSKGITLPIKVYIIKARVFVKVGREERLSAEELMPLNCGTGEDS